MSFTFRMENAIYNSVIFKPRTKLVGKSTVPLTDPQGLEVIQAMMTVQYRMDKPGGGFKALEGMAITDGLICRGGRSNTLAGGKLPKKSRELVWSRVQAKEHQRGMWQRPLSSNQLVHSYVQGEQDLQKNDNP